MNYIIMIRLHTFIGDVFIKMGNIFNKLIQEMRLNQRAGDDMLFMSIPCNLSVYFRDKWFSI